MGGWEAGWRAGWKWRQGGRRVGGRVGGAWTAGRGPGGKPGGGWVGYGRRAPKSGFTRGSEAAFVRQGSVEALSGRKGWSPPLPTELRQQPQLRLKLKLKMQIFSTVGFHSRSLCSGPNFTLGSISYPWSSSSSDHQPTRRIGGFV